MREAAERRQQLELEHEQALAILNSKQKEIELLQKAQVEAKKEHEGAIQLLEAKVCELEEKCRTQSEQFNLLSKELEKFRQQTGKFDLLDHESPSRGQFVISEYTRPLQLSELPLTAGKYLYVYGDMDEDGFFEGELLDGQRGLVPSNFVDFVQDESRLSSGLGGEPEQNVLNHSSHLVEGEGLQDISLPVQLDSGILNNGAGTLDVNIDEIGENIVPYPRKITLIKQLAKSVIVGWEPPVVPPGWGTIHSYNVLVDKEVRMNVPLGSKTKALIEKLNIATCTYRISVQSITSRGNSDELQCTLLVGKDVIVAPSHLKVDNVSQISAEITWLPTNSNYSHVIFLNEEEFDIVRAATYKYQFFNLKPNMAYKVKVLAKPHQMPWQLPLEQQEEKQEDVRYFLCSIPGPPAPPQDIRIQVGPTPGTILVSWKPPVLTAAGTSNGANVTGYGIYAKSQRNSTVVLTKIQSLDAREVLVRTQSAQGESVDSLSAPIPPDLLVPPHPQPAPKSKPLSSASIPDTKEEHLCPHGKRDDAWEQTRAASPVHGHTLEPPNFHSPLHGQRSPSPNRILPQPQGTPVPNTVAKAMAREAAQRVAAESNREYHTESSRGSDLSDIMEEDEEDLYSEMQLEDGGRRRECYHPKATETASQEPPDFARHRKTLFSIPEVAEEESDHPERFHKQGLRRPRQARNALAREGRSTKASCQEHPTFWHPTTKSRSLEDTEERGCSRSSRSSTRSPDSGLDCGSEEEESRFNYPPVHETLTARMSSAHGQEEDSSSSSLRPLLARRKTLVRQSSVEEDFGDPIQLFVDSPNQEDLSACYKRKPDHQKGCRAERSSHEDAGRGWSSPLIENEMRLTSLPLSKQPYRMSEAPPVCCNPSFLLLTFACQITSFIFKQKKYFLFLSFRFEFFSSHIALTPCHPGGRIEGSIRIEDYLMALLVLKDHVPSWSLLW
ncbi:RIMS-binding protein 2, partial [Ophiophagus hannah]